MSISLTYNFTGATFPFTFTLPITGTYTITTWGGGSGTSTTTHTYPAAGPYTVVVAGTGLSLSHSSNNSSAYLKSCNNWTGASSLAYAFFGCSALTLVPTTLPSNSITTMTQMFYNALIFNQNISAWTTTTALKDTSYMFSGAAAFNNGATGVAGPEFSSSWDTSAVTNMTNMFAFASKFNCPVNFNTQSVTNMAQMFFRAFVFNQNISAWTTTNALKNTSDMLSRTEVFNNGATSGQGPAFSISWDTSAVTDMSNMFTNAFKFNCPVNFNTQSVISISGMFSSASVFNQDISDWTTTTALKNTSNMFSSAVAFNNGATSGQGPAFSSSWDTSAVTDMSSMFRNASAFNCPVNFQTQSVTSMSSMFFFNNYVSVFNQDISYWITPALKDTSYMFYYATAFNNGATSGQGPAFSNSWITSTVTNMSFMFANASAFNCPLNFNTQSVTSMSSMFNGASVFNQNVGTWKFGAVVTAGMTDMFNNCGIIQTTYDAMLTSWTTQSPVTLINKNPIGVLNLRYSSPNTSRETLRTTYSNTFSGDIASTPITTTLAPTTTTTLAPTTTTTLTPPITTTTTTRVPIPMPICFLEGTYIYTNHGYELIETLKKGDFVNTFKDNYVPIDSIIKETIYHDATQPRNKKQLFHLSFPNYQQLLKDLYLTGAHSVLVGKLTDTQHNALMEEYKGIYITDLFYRLPVYLDEKASVHPVSGTYTIYHLVLENTNIHYNYGIFANGLLVESLSKNDSLERTY